MLKIVNIVIASLFVLFVGGCVQRDVAIPNGGTSHGNFVTSDSIDENSWAEQTNVDEEENIDISDIDQEIKQTDMTTLAQTTQVVPRIPFPSSEYARVKKRGKGTVKGSIYLIDIYGQRVYGKNTRLYLNPVTSYSNQWYKESYINGRKMEEADSRLFNYLRFTASDNQGEFAFYGVPSGKYYLIGIVKCGTECGFDTLKNIRVATKVEVNGNQIVEKDLYREIRVE